MALKNNKRKGSLQTGNFGALSWFKNVGKSLGYSSTDLVKQLIPASSEFVVSNTDTATQLVYDIRNAKTIEKRVYDSFSGLPQIAIGRNALKNAFEDIKSGNIYNKDRQDAMFNDDEDDFFLSDDMDMEMNDNLSDNNFDNSSIPGGTEGGKANIKNVTINRIDGSLKNSPMVKAVEQQTAAIVETAQSLNNTNIAISANTMLMDKNIGSSILGGLESVNSNLSLLVNFQNDSMSKYIGASLKYYEENLQVLNDTLTEIKRGQGHTDDTPQKKERVDLMDQSLLSNGGLNISGYLQTLKKNLGDTIDSNMFLSPIKMVLEDTDTLKFMAASPLNFLSTKIITSLLPNFLKKSLGDMDKSFENFFPALLMKINRLTNDYSNPFTQILGQIFGVNVRTKSSVDLSKYKKDALPFDGHTKKAITEVIPGYLRKILASITGKEEVAFDYNKGTFKSVFKMANDFKNEKERVIKNNFSDEISEVKKRAEAFQIENAKDRVKFKEDIDKFFVKLGTRPAGINPLKTKDKEGNDVDEIRDVHEFASPEMQRLFRQIILSLPHHMQIRMAGRGIADSRKALEKFMTEAEENPTEYNAATINNGLGFDEHIKRNEFNTSSYELKKGYGINPSDKYGSTSLDYLRTIQKVLLEGVVVYPMNTPPQPPQPPIGPPPPPPANPADERIRVNDGRLKQMSDSEDRYRRDRSRYDLRTTRYTDKQKKEMQERNQWVFGSSLDLNGLSDEDMRQKAEEYAKSQEERPNNTQNIATWFGKFFKGDAQNKYNMIKNKVGDILNTPAKLLSGVFKKIDDTMYKVIFGDPDKGKESGSFISKTLAQLKLQFTKFGDFITTKILTPLKEAIFGKDGLIGKIKDSDFYKNMRIKMSQFSNYLFGSPKGENGKRVGGLMSSSANELLDMWDNARYYFTGKAYTSRSGKSFVQNDKSVFGEMKGMFKGFKDNMKVYLFGKHSENGEEDTKGVFTSVVESLKGGFNNFSEALFGPKKIGGKNNANYVSFTMMKKKIKEGAPKALAWGMTGAGAGLLFGGKLGLLGSLLLPGGPIGGAIVGTTLGFLSQSNKFKDYIFGPKDTDGKRVGGVISKSTQDFMKKNKAGIVGGATVGAVKSILGFGLLPSFFLPGGPIGGAIMGIGTSMLYRSEAIQKFLFGEKDLDGKRSGGIISKIFDSANKHKNLLGNIGAGSISGAMLGLVTSKMGIMGAMLLPGGPIGGAILGAAAGIALSTDKWKKVLFGEFDEESQKRKGGLVGKFTNWFGMQVVEPLKLSLGDIKLNMGEWFQKSIANPFRDALEPLKTEFKVMTDNMKQMFVKGWENFTTFIGNVFEKHVGMPFGKFMDEKVMKPLKQFISRLVGGIGKIFGTILASPFKLLNGLTTGLREKQEQRGIDYMRESGWNDMTNFKGRREKGERLGLFSTKDKDGKKIGKGFFGRMRDMYFNGETQKAAAHGEHGASYADAEDARIKARNEKQKSYFEREKEKQRLKREELLRRQKIASDNDYDNFTENGVNISNIYGSKKKKKTKYEESAFEQTAPRKVLDMYKQMLGTVTTTEVIDANGNKKKVDTINPLDVKNGSSRDKKRLRRAMQLGYDPDAVDAQTKERLRKQKKDSTQGNTDQNNNNDSTTVAVNEIRPIITDSNSHLSGIHGIISGISNSLNDLLNRFNNTQSQDNNNPLPQPIVDNTTNPQPPTVNNGPNPVNGNANNGGNPQPADEITEDSSNPLPQPIIDTNTNPQPPIIVNNPNPVNGNANNGGNPQPVDNNPSPQPVIDTSINPQPPIVNNPNPVNGNNKPKSKSKTASNSNVNTGSFSDARTSSMGSIPTGKGSTLQQIAFDVRTIAKEVYGQLDGLGSNVFKLRKLIQKKEGVNDEDIAGSANRDRIGVMGRIKRFLYAPLDSLKTAIMKRVQWFTDKLHALGQGIANVGKAILSVPVNIAKGLFSFAKSLVTNLGDMVLNISKVPLLLVKGLNTGLQMLLEGMKAIAPALGHTLVGVAKVFEGAMGMVGHSLIGFGKGVGELLFTLGKGTGELLVSFGKTAFSILGTAAKTVSKTFTLITDFGLNVAKGAGEFVINSFASITRFTADVVKNVGEKLMDVGNTLFTIVTSPLKFLAGAISKIVGFKQEVIVVGGHLDSVDNIKSFGGQLPPMQRPNINDIDTQTNSKNSVQNVRIMGSDVDVSVALDQEKFTNVFKKLLPLELKIDTTDKPLKVIVSNPDSISVDVKNTDIFNNFNEHSHASGLDNVPYDNYKANLHRGEMIVPAHESNGIRSLFGFGRKIESKIKGFINESNLGVNSLSSGILDGKPTDVKIVGSSIILDTNISHSDASIPVSIKEDNTNNTNFNIPENIIPKENNLPVPKVKNNGLATDVFKGMEEFDKVNDKEEDKKKKDAQDKVNDAARQKEASKKTAGFQIAQHQALAQQKYEKNWKDNILSLLGRVADDTRTHVLDWASMFGKKGLIALALIAALPLIKKLLSWLMGSGNSNRKNGNDTIANSDLGEHFTRLGGFVLERLSKLFKPLIDDFKIFADKFKGIDKSIGRALEKFKEKGAKIWEDISEKASRMWEKVSSKATETFDRIFGKLFPKDADKLAGKEGDKLIAKEGDKLIAKEGDKLIAKDASHLLPGATDAFKGTSHLLPGATDATKGDFSVAQKALPGEVGEASSKYGFDFIDADYTVVDASEKVATKDNMVTKIINKVTGKNSTKVSEHIAVDATVDSARGKTIETFMKLAKDAVAKIFEICEKKLPKSSKAMGEVLKILDKILVKDLLMKFFPKVMKVVANIAGTAITLGAKEGVWMAWGLSTGLFEAAHLFKIDSDQTDALMIRISGILKMILNTDIGMIIDILNDICVEVTTFDFVQIIATKIYNNYADKTKNAKLKKAQDKFVQETKDYNKSHKTELSVDAYDDMQNKTVGQKIVDGVKWGGKKIGQGVTYAKDKVVQGAQWVGGKVGQGITAVKNVGDKIGQGVTYAKDKVVQGAQWVGGKVGQGITAVKNGAKKLWDNSIIGAGINATSDDAVKNNFHLKGKGTITTGTRAASGISEGLEKATFGLLDSEKTTKTIYGIGVTVQKFWEGLEKAFDDNIVKPVKGTWDKISAVITKKVDDIKKGAEAIWDTLTTNISKGWDSVTSTVGGFIDNIKKGAETIWNNLTSNISKGWDAVTSTVGTVIDDIKKGAETIWNNLTSNISKGWDAVTSTVGTVIDDIKKGAETIWNTLTTNISKGWNAVTSTVGGVLDGIKKTAGDIWNNLPKPLRDAWDSISNTIFGVKDTITNSAESAWNGLITTIDGVWDSIKSTLSKGLENIKKFFSGIGKLFMKPIDAIKNFFTGSADKSLDDLGWKDDGNGDFKDKPLPGSPKPIVIGGGFGDGDSSSNNPDSLNNFAYYSQGDPRWANSTYDHSPQFGTHSENPTIQARGCGPTSMAMVATQLTGKRYLPTQMANIAQNGGFSSSSGTSWSYFDNIAQQFSLNEDKITPTASNIQNLLEKHEPVILSGTRTKYNTSDSPFTTSGHYVVAVAEDGNNRVKINDPRGTSYSKSYDINKVANEAAQGWGFTYNGGAAPEPSDSTPFSLASNSSSDQVSTITDLFGKMSDNFSLMVDNLYTGGNTKLTWDDALSNDSSSSSSGSSSGISGLVVSKSDLGTHNLTQFAPMTVDELNKWIASKAPANSPFIGNGKIFLDASKESGLDPRYIVAHAALESAWGTSQIARDKSNYFGIGSFNATPYASSYSFNPGLASGIIEGAKWIKTNYTDAGQNSVSGMIHGNPNHVYAQYDNGSPNEEWLQQIVDIMSSAPQGEISQGGNGGINVLLNRMNGANIGGGFGDLLTQDTDVIKNKKKDKNSKITINVTNNKEDDKDKDIIHVKQANKDKKYDTDVKKKDKDSKGGGFGDLSSSLINSLSDNTIKAESNSSRFNNIGSNSKVRRFISNTPNNSNVTTDESYSQIFKDAVNILQKIADNTEGTSSGIKDLFNKDTKINIINQSGDTISSQSDDQQSQQNGNTNIILTTPSQQNSSINPIMNMVNERRSDKMNRDYRSAKAIAGGRIN